MADTQDENDDAGEGGGKKRSKTFLFIGLTIGIIGAAGGFYAAYSGVRLQIIWDIRACFRLEALAHP